MTADPGLYVYAITRAGERDLPDPRTRAINHDGLGLVVADVDVATFRDLDADPVESGRLATLVREHDAVVRAVFDREAVLPLRFGTIVGDEDAARQLLSSRRDEVVTWLDHVDGHREWGIRVEQPSDDASTLSDGLSGTEYLRQRMDALRSARNRQVAVDALAEGLSGHAADSVRRRSQALLDAAYLVPRDNEESFRADADRLGASLERLGMAVRTTGPWPPYSFTRIELAVGR